MARSRQNLALCASAAAIALIGAGWAAGARADERPDAQGAQVSASSAMAAPAAAPARGYRSRLEEIAAEQGETIAVPAAPEPAFTLAPAPIIMSAANTTPAAAQGTMIPIAQPAVYRTYQPSPGPRLAPGASPNLFGSVAISIGHTSLDAKWHSVNHVTVSRQLAGDILAQVKGAGQAEMVQKINTWVNHRIAPVEDYQRGESDHWANADESLRAGQGDCEDYAIAKLQILRAAGYDERDLYLVVVKDLVRRADHAILAVRVDGQLVILDSNTDRIEAADQVHDYNPLMTFSGDKAWIHGYRQKAPELQLAANTDAAPVPVPAPAAEAPTPDTGGL